MFLSFMCFGLLFGLVISSPMWLMLVIDAVKTRCKQRGRVRIVLVGKEYQVQTLGLLGWYNDGHPRECEYDARGWAEHLVETRLAYRLFPPPQKVIAEYEP